MFPKFNFLALSFSVNAKHPEWSLSQWLPLIVSTLRNFSYPDWHVFRRPGEVFLLHPFSSLFVVVRFSQFPFGFLSSFLKPRRLTNFLNCTPSIRTYNSSFINHRREQPVKSVAKDIFNVKRSSLPGENKSMFYLPVIAANKPGQKIFRTGKFFKSIANEGKAFCFSLVWHE